MARKPKVPKPPRVAKRRKFDLRKALFVLPNAFTASSIFCGFYAILTCVNPADERWPYTASLAIFIGALFDMSDGRVARLTRTQSEFGREFDSLADVISFGVAPAVLVYRWALMPMGAAGIFIAFAFAACGAIRLARFNVLAIRDPGGSSKYFMGLPIPLAAAALVSLIMAHQQLQWEPVKQQTAIVLVVVLSFLMVSTVRYPTFKEVRMTRRTLTALGTLLLLMAYFAVATRPSVVMVAFVWGYLVMGMTAEVVFFRRRRAAALAGQGLGPSMTPVVAAAGATGAPAPSAEPSSPPGSEPPA